MLQKQAMSAKDLEPLHWKSAHWFIWVKVG